ncbi:dephospho-CoA kinase [Devosia nitrariae]|uniref:Dephospho-CoA kinase n=1 Tax=Devosia nitrariae TaxID=2071872 RepID=A0ABQ5W3T4_9HYPH|nr:dephospho-CoA kinase [Devosia nitrariae]GLQ54546.1 dephospho-CoA kinase [Devosia nitrariae]
MFRLGVTGSIATGKSTVLQAFADFGARVFSADAAVHELYAGPAVAAVESLFPGVAVNGAVDRTRLAATLNAAPQRLAELEALIHPLVRERIGTFMDAAESDGALIAAVEVPLLFESGHDYGFDAVAVTVCDAAAQRERALARPGMTVEKLDTILARQMPQAEKRKRAAFIIDTTGPIEETRRMVKTIVADIQVRQAQQ